MRLNLPKNDSGQVQIMNGIFAVDVLLIGKFLCIQNAGIPALIRIQAVASDCDNIPLNDAIIESADHD